MALGRNRTEEIVVVDETLAEERSVKRLDGPLTWSFPYSLTRDHLPDKYE